MNWLVSQGLTGLPENDLIRGFCERCCAAGLDLSRSMVFIDTLHPIFEGRGFRWNDSETDEADSFEYGPTGDSDDGWTSLMDQISSDFDKVKGSDFEVVTTGPISTAGL